MVKVELTLVFGVFMRSKVIHALWCHFHLPFHPRLVGTACQGVCVCRKTSSCYLLIANWNPLGVVEQYKQGRRIPSLQV